VCVYVCVYIQSIVSKYNYFNFYQYTQCFITNHSDLKQISYLKSVYLPFTITAIFTNPNEPKASLKSFEFASNGRSLEGFEKKRV
jgi:hypothetical protein